MWHALDVTWDFKTINSHVDPNGSAKECELVGRYAKPLVSMIQGDDAKLLRRLSVIFTGWLNSGEDNDKRAP